MDEGQLNNIVNMAEAIDKFGALVIGLAAFMIIAIIAVGFIFSRQKQMNADKDAEFKKLFGDMQTQNQQVFTQLMQTAFKPATPPPEMVPEGITAAGAIHEQLKQVLAVTKADRVSIYVFHNGQRMVNGIHMIKCSCWSEYTMLPRFARIDKHKDMQVSKIQEMSNVLLREKQWAALTAQAVKETELSIFDDDTDVQSAFSRAIFSAEDIIIGFVLIEYLLAPIEPSWVDKARNEIKKLSDKVSLVMDIELH